MQDLGAKTEVLKNHVYLYHWLRGKSILANSQFSKRFILTSSINVGSSDVVVRITEVASYCFAANNFDVKQAESAIREVSVFLEIE